MRDMPEIARQGRQVPVRDQIERGPSMGPLLDPSVLLADTRNYLDVTWADPDGDVKLLGILERGMAYLDHAAGVELDYGEGTNPRALLLDYVRYVRAGALQDFGRDFAQELLGLHIAGEVRQHDGVP